METTTNAKDTLMQAVGSQFGQPRGSLGSLVGWIMAHRSSNVTRSRWVVDLLDLEPGHRVLEIGFGPGVAVQRVAAGIDPERGGSVYGVDHSAVMVRQATRRNRRAIAAGTVDLRQGRVEDLDPAAGPFDRIFTVNSVMFWPDPGAQVARLAERLAPDGSITLALQPRSPGADGETAEVAGHEYRALLEAAGLTELTDHWLDLRPTPVVAVTGRR